MPKYLSRILVDKLFNNYSSNSTTNNKPYKQVDNNECVYEKARKNKDIIIKKIDYPYLKYYTTGERIRNNFNNIINFITIPNREFLKNSNISNDLWWNPEDYIFFRNQSFIEQQVFCRNYPHIDKKQIEKILYQPSCG